MTYEQIKDQRAALVRQIADLVDQFDGLQPQYDALYVDHLRETGEDGHMNRAQIALYADVTPGRVSNIWSAGKLVSEKINGERVSLRSEVDLMLGSKYKRA